MDCVTDSSFWTSLHAGGLVHPAFELPINWLVPDVILEQELKDPSGAELERLGARRCELSGDQVRKVPELAAKYIRVSRIDLFALVQAKAEEAVLPTDDKELRRAAENEGVRVHGTLWVLDQMVERGFVSRAQAAKALEQMRAKNRYLPGAEVEKRLRQWKS